MVDESAYREYSEPSRKDADRALDFVRTGELTHLQKSWALAQVAKLLVKTDGEKAGAILETCFLPGKILKP